VNAVDLIVIGFAFVLAVWGYQQGLIVGGLSLVGFVAGALAGSRIAPLVLAEGARSPYAPLGALAGALLVGALLAGIGELVGSEVRRRVGSSRLDGLGGALLLAAVGLLIAWIAGAAALQTPALRPLRHDLQRSNVLAMLNERLPSTGPVLNALRRFDPLPEVEGPQPDVGPPPEGIVDDPDVAAAAGSVVRVLGTACGLNVQGSGWIAPGGLVVTNAHVVAGQSDTEVQPGGEGPLHQADAVHFDPGNDLAILRSDALAQAPGLELDLDPKQGAPGAILGFPENGGYDLEPGRVGQTTTVISQDAYGRGPIRREMTSVRGHVRQGNSGGPMVGRDGRVQTTIFAAAEDAGAASGFGVPSGIVARALDDADVTRSVSTGPCAR
jgi:S1-C subfamily serine protease